MVRRVSWMRLPATRTHWSSKTKPPDPVLGNRALTEKVHEFGVIAPFQAREAQAFPPEPLAPIISRDIAPAAVGYLSRRLQGSELQPLVYACAKGIAIR